MLCITGAGAGDAARVAETGAVRPYVGRTLTRGAHQNQRRNLSSSSVLLAPSSDKAYPASCQRGNIYSLNTFKEEAFKGASGAQCQYIGNNYSPALWLSQLPYTVFYTHLNLCVTMKQL